MTNMTLSYALFPTGAPITELPPPETSPRQSGAPIGPLTAPATEPAPPGCTFEFWNINSEIYFVPTAPPPPAPPLPQTWTVPSNDFSATAWYFSGGGLYEDKVTTYAFSADENAPIAGQTPIASVNGVPWTSTSTVVPTNAAAVIVAKPEIAGFGQFIGWFQDSNGVISGATLAAPADSDIQAIAYYKLLGTISGTVQEDTDGGMFGLDGAFVSAEPGGVVKSGAGGTYVLTGLQPGTVELSASAPNCTVFRTTLTVVAGQTLTQDIVLTQKGTRF